jgi:hypothetical protein
MFRSEHKVDEGGKRKQGKGGNREHRGHGSRRRQNAGRGASAKTQRWVEKKPTAVKCVDGKEAGSGGALFKAR